MFNKALVTLAFLFTANAFAHPDARISLELDQTTFQAGKVKITFQLVDIVAQKLLTDSDLAITHEKLLHFIAFDKALVEFRHEHPVYNTDHWEVDVDLPKDGQYFFAAQGEIAVDSTEFSALTPASVSGGTQANPVPTTYSELRQNSDQGSIVTFPQTKIKAGQMVMVSIKFSRTDGTAVQITPYLGAMAHVIATPTDADSLIHVHPMDTGQPDVLMLHASFPEVGFYRLWIQFIDRGVLKVVPLMIEVVQ